MFSYVFMKILEGKPGSYDPRMDAISRGRVRAIKEAVASHVAEGSAVLEIGCGTGELASLLAARRCTVEGFDRSRAMVARARERIEHEQLGESFRVRRRGVDGMDGLPADRFDAVVSTLVFSELTDDERRFALRQAARVLIPGGRLVIAAEVVPRSVGQRALHSLSRAPALAVTYLSTGTSTRPVRDLAGDVTAAGFEAIVETRSHGDALTVLVARQREDSP
jgi:cyclopropane fatty-acyl-phospholipid synthase-like methyltransferase